MASIAVLPPASAESDSVATVLSAVVVDGVVDTRRALVDATLDLDAGQSATNAEIEAAAQRLRDTKLFDSVVWTLDDETIGRSDGRARVLRVIVDERASVQPIVGLDRGRGQSRLVVGVRETHALGLGIELGLRVERLDGNSSVEAWMHHPRVLPTRIYVDLAAGYVHRSRLLFAKGGEVEAGFERQRRYAAAEVGVQVWRTLRVGATAATRFDHYTSDVLPEVARAVEVGAALTLGRLRAVGFNYHGATASLRGATPVVTDTLNHAEGELIGMLDLPLRINLAARLQAGVAAPTHPGDDYFLGGLDQLRTLGDGRFHGPTSWVANAEVRVPSLVLPWVALQHVAFVDAGRAAPSVNGWGVVDDVAGGIGLRVIAPKVGNLAVRLDVGWSVLDPGPPRISFGTGQFF